MHLFTRVRTILWLCLSVSLYLGFLSSFVVTTTAATFTTTFLTVYWLLRHKDLLAKKYLADESSTNRDLQYRHVENNRPRLKDLAPGIVLVGGVLIYIGYEISLGTISTRTLQFVHSILGLHASIALMVFLGTFLSVRGLEIIVGSRLNK